MFIFIGFLLLGLGIGLVGTLVGAGGGFILTPLLLLFFPGYRPEVIAASSLLVVNLNALSGTIAYLRLGRIDVKTSVIYGLVASPWVVLGAYGTSLVARGPFDVLLGIALLALCVSLLLGPPSRDHLPSGEEIPHWKGRNIVDRAGLVYTYRFRFKRGIWMSTLIGFLSSFLGIGGGPIYVPVMIRFLYVPTHIATATSQCLLLLTATVAVLYHYLQGNLQAVAHFVFPLAIGVISGAQVGAVLSNRLRSITLSRVLALLLIIVSVVLFYKGFKTLQQ